tara:strand:- start:4077 stop:4586 length:510 start_codon:yes stop_codon:yes gene_type:complete
MAKKCPPGVICIENVTLMFIIIILGVCVYQSFYVNRTYSNNHNLLPKSVYITHNKTVDTTNHQIPITVNTQRMEVSYRQVGILTRVNHSEIILPLFGRMVNTSRVKWQYYTMNDSNNQVRLPLNVNGRSATDEYGVDELYSGDTVYVQGYDDIFKVTVYENNRYMYNPL